MSSPAKPSVAVLVVEDEFLIAEDLRDHLVEAGFEVELARTGADAVAALESAKPSFAGLITDVRLADHVKGWEVAHRARELNPNIPVVYVTGDSAHEWGAEGVPKSVLIPKPFAAAQVVTAISNLLNEGNLG